VEAEAVLATLRPRTRRACIGTGCASASRATLLCFVHLSNDVDVGGRFSISVAKQEAPKVVGIMFCC
jgi:hypothetical protein